MSVAGLYPVEIFRNIASIDAYGELKTEAKKIVRRIDDMGIDNITALKYAIDVSPSRKFKTFLQGMIGTIQSGSDLHIYLSNIVEKYLDEELVERKKNLEPLAVVAEIFVIAIVAFPLFLVIIISIMSFLIGPPNFTIDTLLLFAFVILPLAYLGFYFIIKSVSFEEIKRYKKTHPLFDIKTVMKDNPNLMYITMITILLLSGFVLGVFLFSLNNIVDFGNYYFFDVAFISILIVIGPMSFYFGKVLKKQKEIQDRLSDFFTELSNSVSSGVTIFDAVRIASRGNYGELTSEIGKMKAELSWRLSIHNVFHNFVERMKSGIIHRIFITINKGLSMGGETGKVFQAAAKELNQVNRIEEQKKANMSIYTVVILMSFFVFLAIIIILDRTLFSTFFETAELSAVQTPTLTNAALRISIVDAELFKNSLYSFVFVQGFGTGILGGYMMDGRIISGIRYSFLLGVISIFVFKLLF
jgi:flagellar protein FlaJ